MKRVEQKTIEVTLCNVCLKPSLGEGSSASHGFNHGTPFEVNICSRKGCLDEFHLRRREFSGDIGFEDDGRSNIYIKPHALHYRWMSLAN